MTPFENSFPEFRYPPTLTNEAGCNRFELPLIVREQFFRCFLVIFNYYSVQHQL